MMRNNQESPERRSKAQGGKAVPALCSVLGVLILLAVILTFLPLTVPQWLGFTVYHVESPSMTPAIPMGSAVYIEPAAPEEIRPGEVIAYRAGETSVVHRVVQNRTVEGEFVTQGDANTTADPAPVPYSALEGRLAFHIPLLGALLSLYASPVGKIYALLLAASGLMFLLLAGRLRAQRSARLRRALAEELTAQSAAASGENRSAAPLPEAPAKQPKKRGKIVLVVVLLAVFLGSGAAVLILTGRYRAGQSFYHEAAARYVSTGTAAQPTAADTPTEPQPSRTEPQPTASSAPLPTPPITVDFAALQAQNPDIVGWIYCEDTPINYPLLHGDTNDSYLRTGFDGAYCYAGSIFLDAENSPDFSDDNTIIYGHNLRDGTMFACLENWSSAEFFAAHPVIWILTPTQNYRVALFAGYLTDATAAVYRRSLGDAQARAEYLALAAASADVRPQTAPPQDGRYVLLSTCAYTSDTARYVLHGVLTPAAGN